MENKFSTKLELALSALELRIEELLKLREASFSPEWRYIYKRKLKQLKKQKELLRLMIHYQKEEEEE